MTEFTPLRSFPSPVKTLIAVFIIVLTIGVSAGLYYVGYNTDYTVKGTQEFYGGSRKDSEFDIPDQYPKSLEALLLTTHSHVTSFAVIFVVLSLLFYFTESLPEKWKIFFMIEPLISTLVTFSSFFAIRYLNPNFVYLTMISGGLMYGSYYIMAVIIFKESFRSK